VRDFGVRLRALDVPVATAVGVAAQVIMVPLISWPVLELAGKTADDLSEPARELADKATGTAGPLIFLVMVGVLAPLAEEVFFRGLVLRAFERRIGTVAAVVASSAFFAATHGQPLQFPALFVAGLVFAALVVRTGRLGPAIVAHMAFNITTVVALLWL
jgi:membrane protease YdiL (CAAX protease family)